MHHSCLAYVHSVRQLSPKVAPPKWARPTGTAPTRLLSLILKLFKLKLVRESGMVPVNMLPSRVSPVMTEM